MIEGKEQFKAYLRKIGSGVKTSSGLSREESADALKLILQAKASPAQIGAFMIAHRIRRPEPEELAGMIDTYSKLGPTLTSQPNQHRPICFGMPFDGRSRTAPIYPLVTLLLLSAGQPVVLHGGKRMPIKYGVTTTELFEAIGLRLKGLAWKKVQTCFDNHGLAVFHQPDHFALAEKLTTYRDELAKRPPIASMELIWSAHKGEHLLISGFVHPPTEKRAWEALELLGEKDLISIKGLEGSTDLPISRACITGRVQNNESKRIIIHPRDYQCSGKDLEWQNLDQWRDDAMEALGNQGPLRQALLWNAGAYLWFSRNSNSIKEGIAKAEAYLVSGAAKATLEKLIHWKSNLEFKKP